MALLRLSTFVLIAVLACSISISTEAAAQTSTPTKEPTEPATKKVPPKVKRIVRSLELVARKKSSFSGLVTLRLVGDKRGRDLHYYWGGKCKRSRLKTAHLNLLVMAMNKKLAVQLPSYPIRLGKTVVNCIRSVRVRAD